jgi:hypothetical protein
MVTLDQLNRVQQELAKRIKIQVRLMRLLERKAPEVLEEAFKICAGVEGNDERGSEEDAPE